MRKRILATGLVAAAAAGTVGVALGRRGGGGTKVGPGTRVLITGAGSGLGRAMALRFAREGAQVLVTDVDTDAIAGTVAAIDQLGGKAGVPASRVLDVRDEASWEAARDWVADEWGGLDILVNNAGVAAGGRMELIPMSDWEWILDLNLKSVVRGCRTFIPLFKDAGSGHVVNVASMAGLMNLPSMASYNVTKAAVISLSQTLRHELTPYGVRTTVVCPAFVKTNLGASMRSPDPAAITMAHKMIESGKITPDQVADQVLDAVGRDHFLLLTHPETRVVRWLQRLVPAVVDGAIAARWDRTRHRLEHPHARV